VRILHVLSGDLWAGAEVQAHALLAQLHCMPGVRVSAVLMNEGELARRLRKQGVFVMVLPEDRLNAWQLLRGLHQLLRRWQPDVVHTHRFKEDILGSLANRLGVGAHCVRTAHGAPETTARGWKHKALAAVDRWCAAALQERIIAVTADLAGKLSCRYPANKLVVIENGIDIEAVRIAARATPTVTMQTDRVHIGIVGRLVPVKRVDLFLATAAMLRCREPKRPWAFHVFGDGPMRHSLMHEAEALGISDVTHFHGHCADIMTCIARLDVLIMCSDHEGMPMTLLEAMAVDTAVVGHAVGGIEQLLQSGACGWPVTEHTAAGYTRAVQQALARPELMAQRSSAAAASIEASFSAVRCAERHVILYSQLLAAPLAGTAPSA
jgi:glycosyltransferase involved in cell wall biosynthesis